MTYRQVSELSPEVLGSSSDDPAGTGAWDRWGVEWLDCDLPGEAGGRESGVEESGQGPTLTLIRGGEPDS